MGQVPSPRPTRNGTTQRLRLLLTGDVMTGRGIDQILPHAGDPVLHEPVVRDARDYVRLAERHNGPIATPVEFAYPWGDTLDERRRWRPQLTLVNLETSITTSADHWHEKAVHYRMHPANLPCLTALGVDCAALANNHVLDWGYAGLEETLATLEHAGIPYVGAGRGLARAVAPAIFDTDVGQRVVIFAMGTGSSGIPPTWGAGPDRPGVHRLEDLSQAAVARIAAGCRAVKRPGDIAVASIHWGGNWGYPIPTGQVSFARALIDEAGIDLVHGHSSHHAKAFEVYRERLILYGCGDFLTDYEGIGGYEAYRGELSLMYLPELECGSGRLTGMRLVPFRHRRLRLERAGEPDMSWLENLFNREGGRFGSGVRREEGALMATWPE